MMLPGAVRVPHRVALAPVKFVHGFVPAVRAPHGVALAGVRYIHGVAPPTRTPIHPLCQFHAKSRLISLPFSSLGVRTISSLSVIPSSCSLSACGSCSSSRMRTLSSSPNLEQSAAVFDRRAKLLQRERAAADPSADDYDFLKEEIGYRVSDRVLDVARKLPVLVDIGSGRGWVTRHLTEHQIEKVIAIEMSDGLLSSSPDLEEGVEYERLVLDEDCADLPIADSSVDVVTSCLSLHWVNNLPELFAEISRILKPDGVFIGSMFGGDTLVELRVSLQLAEMERQGGFIPRVSPFVEVRDLGALLNGAKFTMLTIDTDDMKVRYASIFPLMRDLKGMAENNAAINRNLHVRRETLMAANAIYNELYQDEEGGVPATFHVFYWIGWKPDPSQPKALKPQKSDVSLKDLHRLDEIAERRGVYEAETEDPKNK